MKDRIEKELLLNHPIDRVWQAISTQEEIASWFLSADFKAEVGYRYTFTSPDPKCSPIIGEVLKASPYVLAYTWIEQGLDIVTTVQWTLEEKKGSTLLRLAHYGISNYEGETALTMFNSFSGGWEHCFNSLGDHLKSSVHAG